MTEEVKKDSKKQPAKQVASSSVKTSDDKTADKEDKKTAKKTAKTTKQSTGFPEVKPGMTVRVHQKLKEKTPKGQMRERIQVFEGMVLARKGGKGKSATITVRKKTDGIGVEKIFPLHSPIIDKIEIVKKARVRRAKLYYLRSFGKKLKEEKVLKEEGKKKK